MNGLIVIGILLFHGQTTQSSSRPQQPPASVPATATEKPWPPDGVSRVGGDVLAPRLVQQVKPNYTAAAMREKIQGIVTLDAVVKTDGSVGEVRVAKSLDRENGLDDEAINCVKKWRFKPASRKSDGVLIPVVVQIDMSFSLKK